ncbi:hypothetical protein [Rummeliibacillus pycnus]|uniref:hypothetical protein n=1 Tax=Rummeliibacillus pycnus TaxID=101070 RepID=UPI000C9CE03A|nr:hypothetical protein [Rummeliibacillus pycnus]
MYIKVDSVALLNDYNQIWMECWLEKGYGLENDKIPADRYIITDTQNHKVGSIEFKPYSLDITNNINKVYPFYKIESLKNNPNSVVEVDKVAILKQYRGKNLERLLTVFINYAESHNINYCVALLERVFYKALKNVYKIPIKAVGEKIYYKGDYVIPTIVNPREVYQNREKYSWLLD